MPRKYNHSDAETVHGLALSLERVDDVLGGDGLALRVVGVDERVTDDDVEEGLQDLAGLRVDGGGDSLHAASARETSDRGLGDAREDVLLLRSVLSLTKALTLTFTRHWRRGVGARGC